MLILPSEMAAWSAEVAWVFFSARTQQPIRRTRKSNRPLERSPGTIVGAAPEPLSVSPLQIIMAAALHPGRPSGTAKDSEDTLQFSALPGIRPMIERYPLEKAADAYGQMISGRARFRVVLTVASS